MSLRSAQPADAPAVTRIFQSARAHSLPYLPILHDDAEDHAYFAGVVEREEVTLSEDRGVAVAFLALDGDEVDHLYVHRRAPSPRPRRQIADPRAGPPRPPRAVGLPAQRGAIAFYAAHGFAVVESTDGTGNEEHEPDHRMAWSLR